MRLVSFYFGGGQYSRLAPVLAYTARRFNPAWSIEVQEVDATRVAMPHGFTTYESHWDNSWKLELWTRVVRGAPDGDRVLFVDTDTFVTGDLTPLWDNRFDVAYTYREKRVRFPLNGGVVAVRVNPASRAFMKEWLAKDRQFLFDPDACEPWRKKFGGMNQASFGALLAQRSTQLNLAALPCREWNCEDSNWHLFDPDVTRIVHVKSALRMAIFDIGVCRSRRLVNLWKKYEAQALASA